MSIENPNWTTREVRTGQPREVAPVLPYAGTELVYDTVTRIEPTTKTVSKARRTELKRLARRKIAEQDAKIAEQQKYRKSVVSQRYAVLKSIPSYEEKQRQEAKEELLDVLKTQPKGSISLLNQVRSEYSSRPIYHPLTGTHSYKR